MENKFIQAISNIDYTENGARCYVSTHNKNLDFFALAGAQRNDPELAMELFKQAFVEDSILAIKNLFYIRDVRGGQGVRSVFRECMSWLLANDDRALKLLKFIPEYGYWKDLFSFYEPFGNRDIDRAIETIVINQIMKDKLNAEENKPISLCAKWFPLANNTKNPQKKAMAKSLTRKLGREAWVRNTITLLREYLNVTERNICANEYEKIDYKAVPSKSLLRNNHAFINNDYTRYSEYLQSVKAGKTKINTGAIYPFELVKKYINSNWIINQEDSLIEEMWKNLPDYTHGSNAICIVDTSGSMTVNNYTPLSVAISLGIYFAERNNSSFKNAFLTFSANPQLITINQNDSLLKKVNEVYESEWGMNTNIERAFKVILSEARVQNVPPEDMPKTLYIISDMQFDEAVSGGTNYSSIREQYKKYGYELPHIVFWNVASRKNQVPVNDANDSYVTLVSGYSPIVFKYVLEGKTPLEFMHEVLGSNRYAPLEEAFN